MIRQARDDDIECGDGVSEQALMTVVVSILKTRKARIMPRTASLEEAARMAETMSFTLVLACVLDHVHKAWCKAELINNKEAVCPIVDGLGSGKLVPRKTRLDSGAALLFLPAVLTPIAMRWLWKEPQVVNELVLFFSDGVRGEMRPVIRLAAKKAGLGTTSLGQPIRGLWDCQCAQSDLSGPGHPRNGRTYSVLRHRCLEGCPGSGKGRAF